VLRLLSESLDRDCFRDCLRAIAAAINRCVALALSVGWAPRFDQKGVEEARALVCRGSSGPPHLKPSQTKPNQAKPSQTKPNQAKPSQTKPNQAKPNQPKTKTNSSTKKNTKPIRTSTKTNTNPTHPRCRDLYNDVATEAAFSATGARQFGVDVRALLRLFQVWWSGGWRVEGGGRCGDRICNRAAASSAVHLMPGW